VFNSETGYHLFRTSLLIFGSLIKIEICEMRELVDYELAVFTLSYINT